MMQNLLRRIFTLRHNYANPIERQRARGLLIISSVIGAVWTLWMLGAGFAALGGTDILGPGGVISSIPLPFALYALYYAVQRGRLQIASWVFTAWLLATIIVTTEFTINGVLAVSYFLPLVASGVLLGRNGMIFTTVSLIGVYAVGAVRQSQQTVPSDVIPADFAILNLGTMISATLLIVAFLLAFSGGAQSLVDNGLRYIEQLNKIVKFATRADRRHEFYVYQQAVRMLRNEFGYVIAQFYVADIDKNLPHRLRLGDIDSPDEMLERVRVADASILKEAALSRETVVITLSDPAQRRGHLLPSVNTGAAIPVINDSELLGVIDVQTADDTIDEEALTVLQALATQIATLVREVRRENALRNDLAEQQAVQQQLTAQLRGDLRSGDPVLERWLTYIDAHGRGSIGFDMDMMERRLTPASDLSPYLRSVLENGKVIVEDSAEGGQVMSVPIQLGSVMLGAMMFTAPSFNEFQIDMAQNVANRLAVALENKRLYEQSQAQANRERTASEAGALLMSATDVDVVLSLAANTFNDALDAIQTRIQLHPATMRERRFTSDGDEFTAKDN